MNDAHIYCSVASLKEELRQTFELALTYYKRFRFEGVRVRLSTHDPKRPEKFVVNPELWQFSESIVEEVLKELDAPYFIGPGEAAFYGPKIDFQAKTLIGREETISTTQLDFSSPLKFDLEYQDQNGEFQRPYIIHRAPLGTHERFLAFLIEHFGGAFPTWMSPTQVMIIPVGNEHEAYAKELVSVLKEQLFRVSLDNSDASFNKKIRNAVTHKIPNIIIVGEREVANRQVTLRRYCVKEQAELSFEKFVERMIVLRKERIMDNFSDVIV
jgi:threonyl-tRNA synthetase